MNIINRIRRWLGSPEMRNEKGNDTDEVLADHRLAAEEALERGVPVTVEITGGVVTKITEHELPEPDAYATEGPPDETETVTGAIAAPETFEPKPRKPRASRKSKATALAAEEKRSKARKSKED